MKKTVINMLFNRLLRLIPFAVIGIFFITGMGMAQTQQQDQLPVREYTNPEEVVTFDRTTSFIRALDVINGFAKEYRNKVILDRTNTQGNLGISVPAMHWMDALKLILRVKELQLVEKNEFYEIIKPQPQGNTQVQTTTAGGGNGGGEGEGPIATTQTKEVRINAIFFEGNRRALQEIGVDWSTISEGTPAGVTDATEGASVPSSQYTTPFVQVNSEGASNVSQRVFDAIVNLGEIGNTGISVQSLFSAFEAENLGEILSSPNVKVMDGQSGSIQVGQDFSVKQRDFAGNVVEEFFSVGTILEVTPNIIEQNDTTFVHLNIAAERSSAQPDPVSTVINKQEAQTQALLLDGQSTVIAGLYRTEKSKVRRGVPILKDLPPWFFGLRYLFGYTSNDFLMRELIILLQVEIEPTIPERMEDGIVKNRYKSLQDERRRIRENIEQSDKIFRGQDVSENLDLEKSPEEELPNNIQKEEEPPEESNSAPESQEEQKQTSTETEDTDPQVSEKDVKDVEEDTVITDPEMADSKVELNLGASPEKENSNSENAKTEDAVEEPKEDETANTDVDKKSESEKTANYYIIGGSFTVDENAKQLRNRLRSEGFNAVLLKKPNSDLTYVAYQGYNNINSAQTGLADIQQNENAEAWLFRANSQ